MKTFHVFLPVSCIGNSLFTSSLLLPAWATALSPQVGRHTSWSQVEPCHIFVHPHFSSSPKALLAKFWLSLSHGVFSFIRGTLPLYLSQIFPVDILMESRNLRPQPTHHVWLAHWMNFRTPALLWGRKILSLLDFSPNLLVSYCGMHLALCSPRSGWPLLLLELTACLPEGFTVLLPEMLFPHSLRPRTGHLLALKLPPQRSFLTPQLMCISPFLYHALCVFFKALMEILIYSLGFDLSPALACELSQWRLNCLVHFCIPWHKSQNNAQHK